MLHYPKIARDHRGIVGLRADASDVPSVGEIAAQVREVVKLFEDFKAANDERLANALAGKADVVLDEKVERINANLSEQQTVLDGMQSQVEALNRSLIGGAPANGDADRLVEFHEAAGLFLAAATRDERLVEGITDDQVAEVLAYGDFYGQYLRRGDKAYLNELSVGSDPDGGYWVPPAMSTSINTRLFETSPMRQVCAVIVIPGGSIEFPTDTNSAVAGGWVAEKDTRAETATPQVGMQEIFVREQYAMPQATQKLLDMATINVEAWLAAKIADILARTENAAFVTGNGSMKPRGILDYGSGAATTDDSSRSWGVLQYIPIGAAGAFPVISGSSTASDPDALVTTISKLKPAYRPGARWMMSRATEAAVRVLKDKDGRYLVGIGDLRDPASGFSLLGYPITTGEDFPAIAANSFSIAFGNFAEGYQIVDGPGLRVLRDPFTTKGRVKFYTTKWTGGDVVNFDAIKLVKFAAS